MIPHGCRLPRLSALPSWLRNLPDFVDRRMQLGELLTFTKVLPQEVCRHFGFEISRIVEESDCLWSVDRGQKSLSAAESASEQVVVEKVICFWLNGAQESGLPFDLVLRLRHTNGSEEVLYIENNWEFCLSFPQLQFAASHPKNYVILVISSLRSGAPRWAAIPDVSSSIGLSRLCSPEGSNTGGAPEAADGEVGGVEPSTVSLLPPHPVRSRNKRRRVKGLFLPTLLLICQAVQSRLSLIPAETSGPRECRFPQADAAGSARVVVHEEH
ncbi:hypothetical protein cyc_09095 [Cyclospora cayetanensis]|uniref:Uncharacterized protein n=1 Tax=Cyclospora cayetanensis TaxID=88456 RepID=A0A1D3D001_9EIME|nr:hypothetical protein cyc_09095 [Cyclospora cayetanensis]